MAETLFLQQFTAEGSSLNLARRLMPYIGDISGCCHQKDVQAVFGLSLYNSSHIFDVLPCCTPDAKDR